MSDAARVLVTGASGFVGAAVVRKLVADGRHAVRAAVRRPLAGLDRRVEQAIVGDLGRDTRWDDALRDVDAIVHAAARVHVMHEQAADPLQVFRAVNVDGTLHLARTAAAAGVRRFVFVSSIKVNGDATPAGRPFRAGDAPAPVDAYGLSKREAEDALRTLAQATPMQVAIVRAPLVYGPGVKANFASLMRAVAHGVPLPLGAIDNRRSLVALDNLVDLLVTCIEHAAAANRTFLAGDGEDLSTPDLLRRLGVALGRPARLLPVPPRWLELGAALAGRGAAAQRLCQSLQVDIGDTQRTLDWRPPVTVDAALRATAAHFLAQRT